jgi:hypothetical protein
VKGCPLGPLDEMSEPEQIVGAVPHVQKYWWAEAWSGARPRFVATAKELIISIGTLIALAIFYLFTRLMILAGVPAQGIEIFRRVDYWLMFAVYMAFAFLFAFETLMSVYAEMRNTGKTP